MRALVLLTLAATATVCVGGCAAGGSSNDGTGAAGAGAGAGGATTSTGGSGGVLSCAAPETPCDDACTTLDSDPRNCGGCGVTCVVPNAIASCTSGVCGLGTCDDGFADCDGNLDNGCEMEVDCAPGGACTTSCDTTGLINCADACAPTCDLPPEACNLADDDCNDACDDGAIAGCRVSILRAFGGNGHYYGTSQAEAEGLGYNVEFLDYFYLYASATGPLQPFFRCPKGGGQTFLTTATDCEIGVAPETTIGFISATAANCDSVPLYRTRNGSSNAHFYTTSAGERDHAVNNLGFVDEGIAGYIWAAP